MSTRNDRVGVGAIPQATTEPAPPRPGPKIDPRLIEKVKRGTLKLSPGTLPTVLILGCAAASIVIIWMSHVTSARSSRNIRNSRRRTRPSRRKLMPARNKRRRERMRPR